MRVSDIPPRVDVLPEDDRDRQLAVGFRNHQAVDHRRMKILPPAGGWTKVLDVFLKEHVSALREKSNRCLILLVDFDEKTNRRAYLEGKIPEDLKSRVFLIGPWKNPEKLKVGGKYEEFGSQLAHACQGKSLHPWDHPLLAHNANELERLREHVRPILFGQ